MHRDNVVPRRGDFSVSAISSSSKRLSHFLSTPAWGRALGAMLCGLVLASARPASGAVLWSDLGSTLVHETGAGIDILERAVKEDDSSTNTLFFKFHVDPLSDASTEEYFAAFELYEGDKERLGVGNALKAWAYSAFKANMTGESREGFGYIDLNSSKPEPSAPGSPVHYENPHRGIECTIVFKVQYVANDDDLVTVWLNPDLGPGATEAGQPESLITSFKANAAFNEVHLRHRGGGGGWIFSDMVIATSFSDLVVPSGAEPRTDELGIGAMPFTFRSWQREQGLPQDSVRAITQTQDGYLWIGTDDGVARFDGVRFISFSLPEGLRSGPVRTLFGDSRGSLWIGSVGVGLIHWQSNRFTTFTMKDGLPSDSITALAEDNEARMWIGTRRGLTVWATNQPTLLAMTEIFKGKPITALYKDRQGSMWIGAAGAGVFTFQAGRLVELTDAAVGGLLQDPRCLLVDKRGRIWIGTGDEFILCRDNGQWRPYRIPRHFAGSFVNALVEQPDGTVWAGSAGEGLLQFKEGKLLMVNASSGLSDNSVESLLTDRDGNFWVGTVAGLNLLRQKNLFAFGQNEGLGYGAVGGLAEIAPGLVWAGKLNDGLYRWDGKSFSRLSSAILSIDGTQINSLLMSRDGSCWAAGGQSLLHFKSPKLTVDKAELFTLPGANIISMCEAPDGSLWVGTREGKLWRLKTGHWLAQTNLAQNHPITAIAPEADGGIWIGTEGSGVYHFKNGSLTRLSVDDGLLSNLIRALYPDAGGGLWIGTAAGGLSCYRHGRIASFTMREGLPDNTISQILEDDMGRLWLGSNRGIACVNKFDLEQLMAGKVAVVYPQVYGRMEGMASEACSGGFCPAGLKTRAGLLWFSTLKGLVVVDPRLRRTKTSPPDVLLEEVLVDGVANENFRHEDSAAEAPDGKAGKGSETEMLSLAPGKHRLELRYTGLSFDAPERVRFRYRLEGLDSDWVEAGTRRTAFYNYVPPGRYQFRVVACNDDGVWSKSGVELTLNVPARFWQTWWFISFGALGSLALVGGTVRIVEKRRVQQRLRHLEQERALERERSRIAQDLHDEMGAKLCRISFLSEDARRGQKVSSDLKRQLVSISDSSREVLYSLDEIVWAVNPQNDTLEHTVSYVGHYAQEYFQETGVECVLSIPAQLPPHPLSSQWRHHLLLAVRESFTNILKHSGATRATISVVCEDAVLQIKVSDNGQGVNLAAAPSPATGQVEVAGDGLQNMRQRMTAVGGDCTITSRVGQGTTVCFIMPLKLLHTNT
jgi:ligand-binding sensor domain-containing protein/signal transduction histidine kinase